MDYQQHRHTNHHYHNLVPSRQPLPQHRPPPVTSSSQLWGSPPPPRQHHCGGGGGSSCPCCHCSVGSDHANSSRSMLILRNRHRSVVRLKKWLNQDCRLWRRCRPPRQQLTARKLLQAFLPSRHTATALLQKPYLMGAVAIFLLLAIQPCQGTPET